MPDHDRIHADLDTRPERRKFHGLGIKEVKAA
jgi:hypothetical protein